MRLLQDHPLRYLCPNSLFIYGFTFFLSPFIIATFVFLILYRGTKVCPFEDYESRSAIDLTTNFRQGKKGVVSQDNITWKHHLSCNKNFNNWLRNSRTPNVQSNNSRGDGDMSKVLEMMNLCKDDGHTWDCVCLGPLERPCHTFNVNIKHDKVSIMVTTTS